MIMAENQSRDFTRTKLAAYLADRCAIILWDDKQSGIFNFISFFSMWVTSGKTTKLNTFKD